VSGHTPGPWVAECIGVSSHGPDGVDVYEVTNGYTRIAEHVSEADARLIAAAPELLEALQKIANVDKVPMLASEVIAVAKAAIAKATGAA